MPLHSIWKRKPQRKPWQWWFGEPRPKVRKQEAERTAEDRKERREAVKCSKRNNRVAK